MEISTYSFSVDGIFYEIELSADGYKRFLEVMNPFMKAGRRISDERDQPTPPSRTEGAPGGF
ncbi:histone-like nucleoid-structuring protein Lsr2 [Streptomyces sp. NPDC057686]|uniref:Lsr2 dimerization domain-containing protein n=1 Tax=Streptomyces sp. NPDC057686 TaxID=3346212 RepID=UPI00368B0A53